MKKIIININPSFLLMLFGAVLIFVGVFFMIARLQLDYRVYIAMFAVGWACMAVSRIVSYVCYMRQSGASRSVGKKIFTSFFISSFAGGIGGLATAYFVHTIFTEHTQQSREIILVILAVLLGIAVTTVLVLLQQRRSPGFRKEKQTAAYPDKREKAHARNAAYCVYWVTLPLYLALTTVMWLTNISVNIAAIAVAAVALVGFAVATFLYQRDLKGK